MYFEERNEIVSNSGIWCMDIRPVPMNQMVEVRVLLGRRKTQKTVRSASVLHEISKT